MSASNNKNCSYININQKISIVFDGKKYTNGFPDMKWQDGKVTE